MTFTFLLMIIVAGLVILVVYLLWRVASVHESIARLRRRIKKMEGEED